MRCVRVFGAATAALLSFAVVNPVPLARAETPGLDQKINPYIKCMNEQSGRAYQARERYFSWAGKNGPTGKEAIIYGTYTIYDTGNCVSGIAAANSVAPHDPELEAAATEYVAAVATLGLLLNEANDYYDQQNYKDDKMAKGKAMHPKLVAAWTAFAAADDKLRGSIDVIQDKQAVEQLAEIERTEGHNRSYHLKALMLRAKTLLRAEGNSPPDLAKITAALGEYEAIVKATGDFAASGDSSGIGSHFLSVAKAYLTTAKQLMRRVREKTSYTAGEKMIMSGPPGGGWMVEGSPARLARDYNDLVDTYNRGAKF